jgi:hypothetical protein
MWAQDAAHSIDGMAVIHKPLSTRIVCATDGASPSLILEDQVKFFERNPVMLFEA